MSREPHPLDALTRERVETALREHTLPLDAVVRLVIETAVARRDGCITRAAADLGIGRTTVYRRMRGWELP